MLNLHSSTRDSLLKLLKFSLIISASLLCALFLWYQRIFPHSFKLGERSLQTIVTKQKNVIIDEAAIALRLAEVRGEVLEMFFREPVLRHDPSQKKSSLDKLDSRIQELDLYFRAKQENPQSEESYGEFSLRQWRTVKPLLLDSAQKILLLGYPGYVDLQFIEAIHPKLSTKEAKLLRTVLQDSLSVNLDVDLESFQTFAEKELEKIEPITKTIPAESVIVRKGQLITPDRFATLRALDLDRNKNINLTALKEAITLTCLLSLGFWFYVRLERFRLNIRQTSLLLCLFLLAAAWVGLFAYNKTEYLPLAVVTMSASLFFNVPVGFSAGFLFGILSCLALELSPLSLLPSYVGAVAGALLCKRANNRFDLARASIYLALLQPLAFLVLVALSPDRSFAWSSLIAYGVSGFGAGVFVALGMPWLEFAFGVVNRFRLLELADPHQPLLKRLHSEAPGTYEHTMMVADLAEEAAKKIGLDHELVRTGALYHDIGKMYNPQIFIENQFETGENPHDKLKALDSAKAIIEHVPSGIELAKKYRLPEPIWIFIPTHQGTARAGHFFQKAKQLDPDITDDSQFRYPGPKPISKETAVLMLADTMEATIRSLKTDDRQLVKQTIRRMIDLRIQDDQLSESGLTSGELDLLADSFFESWKSKNHERIQYSL